MTNYNDGKWHAWVGEDMKPATIHDKSLVEYIWHHEGPELYGRDKRAAGWDENDESPAWNNILKFRVVKEHKEPREFWVGNNDGYAYKTLKSVLRDPMAEKHDYIHVREVLDND